MGGMEADFEADMAVTTANGSVPRPGAGPLPIFWQIGHKAGGDFVLLVETFLSTMITETQLQAAHAQLRQFGDHYDYDITYLQEILDGSPEGFVHFQGVMEMSTLGAAAPAEVRFVAKVAAYAVVDCGPCLELSLKMGREAGVADAVLHGARCDGEGLEPDLKHVHGYAAQVAAGGTPALETVAALRERYGSAGLVEIALNVASALVFPALKRSLGHAQSCTLTAFSV